MSCFLLLGRVAVIAWPLRLEPQARLVMHIPTMPRSHAVRGLGFRVAYSITSGGVPGGYSEGAAVSRLSQTRART